MQATESAPESAVPFLERVLSLESYYVLLAALIPGFGLIFGSILLRIAFWTACAVDFATVNREVGYVPAVNWSFTYALLFPAAIYLMAEAVRGMADALDCLHQRGMVRDRDLAPVRSTIITDSWIKGTKIRSWFLAIFALVIPVLYSFTEWYRNNLLRLLHRGPAAGLADYDWGLAGIMNTPGQQEWSLIRRVANATFDFFAFSTECLLLVSCFAFFIFLLDLGRTLPGRGRRSAFSLVPDLASEDPRRGFEDLADPLQEMLGVTLLAYLMCYCVVLEGAYLKSKTATSLADFVQSDIWAGISQAVNPSKGGALASIFQHLFTAGDQTLRGTLSASIFVLVFTFSLIVVAITARGAAGRARSAALRYLSAPSATSLFGLGTSVEIERAKSMVVWPLGYLKLNWILLGALLAECTLYFYRVGLFAAGFVIVALLSRLMYRLIKPG